MPEGLSVRIGKRDYGLVPQGIGRIRRKIVQLMALADGGGLDGELDAELYDLLKTFIPDLDPPYRLLGYTSQEALDGGADPDDPASEVTFPQLLDAVEGIYTVNGADRLVRLGKSLGIEKVLTNLLQGTLADWALERSVSSQPPSGESDSQSSTPTPPTSPETSEDQSPSPASSTSGQPESIAGAVS